MIRHPGPLVGLALAGLVAQTLAAGPNPVPVPSPAPGPVPAAAPAPRVGADPALTLPAYRELAASQWRNYDRIQDISPRQLLILLEVAERTGTSLGQALATGELESARTWNDFVRPTLRNGSLGAATGVWQFMPGTFHMIIRKYGDRLLAASAADPAAGRRALDLAAGPFTDAQVRAIIQETVDGKRGADDETLKLLRHNFAVLAFAKHYLSVDSGATTPEEDYLFHFLGATQGRRVLALARGEARDTLCVKLPPPAEAPADPTADALERLAGAAPGLSDGLPPAPMILARPEPAAPAALPPALLPAAVGDRRALAQAPARDASREDRLAALRKRGAFEVIPAPVVSPIPPTAAPPGFPTGASADSFGSFPPPAPPPPSSEWGLPANSPTVTGNLGMFYRDGKGQSQPYTWGGFMENLARKVRAKDQPAMVRAKYGVGFGLKGGDLPERAFDPGRPGEPVEFRPEPDRPVLVPEALILGPLDQQELGRYKERLAALTAAGEVQPAAVLPPEAVAVLRGLKLLPPKLREPLTTDPQVRKALAAFRKKVGKDAPDDAALAHLLMPTERIALEVYWSRLSRYAELQGGQQASLAAAIDLNRFRKLPAGHQKRAAPRIAAVQAALADRGLLTQPTQKVTWRDKKRRQHVEFRPAPFSGKPDKATIAALNTFQLRHGLRRTNGVLDAVTLTLLGIPPIGSDVFNALRGPQCDFDGWTDAPPRSERPTSAEGDEQTPPLPPRTTRSPGLYLNAVLAAGAPVQTPIQ